MKNRTTDTFRRFFAFVIRFFPSLSVFVCDRHFAQARAIVDVFGQGARVIHCVFHLARNILRHVGTHAALITSFWNMRYKRTQSAEDEFVSVLRRLHNSRRSMFTTHLMNSLDTFLPSRIDPVVCVDVFPALSAARAMAFEAPPNPSHAQRRALTLLGLLRNVERVACDIFTHDNLNVIVSYFNVVKGRIPDFQCTILDVYKAIDLTERMSWPNPFRRRQSSRKRCGLRFCLSSRATC